MNVDGFHPNAVPVDGRSLPDSPTKAASAREARRASAVKPQDIAQVRAALTDRYEHVDSDSVTAVSYRPDRPTSSSLTVNEADEGGAEIVDLETVVTARGLPLLPEKERQSVLAQEVLRAYDSVHGEGAPHSPDSPDDLFNTTG